MNNIILVAGARPNFVKIAPLMEALKQVQSRRPALRYSLVHTGQHYDAKMSQDFFDQLGIPNPDVNLEAGGGTQAEQTGAIMTRFEKYLQTNPCDLVILVGDVTSTLACSVVAKKSGIKVAHVEGGIRSHDQTMPEEINRLVTDSISDYFFTTSREANKNLKKEGKSDAQIYFVGNTMIDTLLKNLARFRKPEFWEKLKLSPAGYFVMTLHRPSNVDSEKQLQSILTEVANNAGGLPVIFPVHPRTRANMDRFTLGASSEIHCIDPLGYLEFNFLVKNAKAVITDSGGITEEATVLGIPCITLRNTTERPETCTVGTNELIGTDPLKIGPALKRIIDGNWKKGAIPELWDGKTSSRIVDILLTLV